MIAAADRARRVLVPFQNTRFAAPFAAAAQQVREGAIGHVTGFRVAFGHAGPPLTLLTASGDRTRVELPNETGSPLDELLAAVRGERAPTVTAADGRAAVAVVEAAYRSAATGELTKVP